MFYGQKEAAIDDKGRLVLPAIYRYEITGQTCFVCYGLDGCMELYPQSIFEKIEANFSSNSFETDAKARRVKRVFLSNSFNVQIDSHNRILLPKSLIEKTHTNKKVVILGIGDHLQIWDQTMYEKISVSEEESFADDAQALVGSQDDGV